VDRKAYDAAYYAEHRDKILGQKRVYHVKHADVIKARAAKWKVEHRDEARAYDAEYYVEHHDERRAYNMKWTAEHPEAANAIKTNYTHRKRANGGTFSRATWEHLKTLFGHCCAYCRRRMKRLEQDHVIPISKGGWHFSGNIVPACRSCNSRKGAKV
jgi:5-methylcytosine-specific restriction endonuclease McrA